MRKRDKGENKEQVEERELQKNTGDKATNRHMKVSTLVVEAQDKKHTRRHRDIKNIKHSKKEEQR